MTTQTLIAGDGTRLRCTLWDNVRRPIGVVQIIHGMDEHVGRYARFAQYMNQNGYIVFGDDHRGHGRTAGGVQNIGRVGCSTDLFMDIVSDELAILKYLNQKYNLPVFVFGHSYGSFITQRIMQESDLCAAGVCMSGSARYPRSILGIATVAAWIGQRAFGANAPARALEFFLPIRGRHATRYLTRDAHQVALRDADPLRAKYFSYGFYYSLFRNLMHLPMVANRKIPLLIISGNRDIVSINARLARSLYRAYQGQNMNNLTLIIYPHARHELLLDTNYADVQNDILGFFNGVLNRH